MKPQAGSSKGPRVNEKIDSPEIRFINAEGENVGVVKIEVALEEAAEAGLDLIEISPNANPPVCKILDYGKYKYEAQKKKTEARKKQKTINIKEVKVRPNIEAHDYEVKLRNVRRFIEDGDKVKVTLRFRGRELAHQNLGRELLNKIKDEVEDLAKVEQFPRMEGRQMIMILVGK